MVNLTVWISKNLARDDLGLQKNEVIWSDKCTDVRRSCYSSVQLSNFLKIQSVIEKQRTVKFIFTCSISIQCI